MTRNDPILPALGELNAARRGAGPPRPDLERHFAETLGAHQRLAVYGSLAPGQVNHGVVSPLGGRWERGLHVEGELLGQGWASGLGFPALAWRAGGPPVAVQLLTSPDLPSHWPRLDAFEGTGYVRILVPVHRGRRLHAVANLYAAAASA